MKFLFTILILFFTWTATAAVTAGEEDKIIKTSRDFSIRCRSLKTDKEPEKRTPVTVYAEYSSKKQEIIIRFNKETEKDTFLLKYPLDFEVFTQKFDSLLNKGKDDPLFVYYGSHLDVFYWIVTITEDRNLPLAGTLTTSQYVIISSYDGPRMFYTDRAKIVKSAMDSLELRKAELKILETQLAKIDSTLKKETDSGKKTILQGNYDNTQKSVDSKKAAVQSRSNDMEESLIRKVSHVQYQFEKGYLERIQVYIESAETGNKEVYENAYPVGFSSVSNYKNITRVRLFRRTSKHENDVKDEFIYLSDIIKLYENELNLATRDYSPGDTTITVYPHANPITRLTKQNSFYIIDGKTFTDVTGLSEDSPNGLVQVELSRRFNLWTHRFQVRASNNYGFVNYVNAKVNFSKIENKLKGLPLHNQLVVENDAIVSPSYATNLDYLRYENLGITLDINAFLFDAPDFKYTIFLDAGIHYGHTPIIDSIYEISQGVATTTSQQPNNLDAHNFTVFPRVKIQLFAERRYGLSLSYQANYTWLFTNNRFKQVVSYSGKGQDLYSLSTNQRAHWSNMIEAAFYVDVNPNSSTGKIFATARFFFQHGDINTFYPQILLGYAFNIFK